MSQRSGCLLGPILSALGASSRPALTGRKVPDAPRGAHASERPALARARGAALACMELLFGPAGERIAPEVSGQVADQVLSLLEQIYALGEELASARRFVGAHDPDRLGREVADLELQLLGVDYERHQALTASLEAVKERSRHAAQVQREIGTMEARLGAAVETLATLGVRLRRLSEDVDGVGPRTETVLADLREEEEGTARVLQAYARTYREIASLDE